MEHGCIDSYVHTGRRVGALVDLRCESDFVASSPEFQELAHLIAQQVVATSPQYRSVDDIPVEEIATRRSTFEDQARKEGHSAELAARIADGQLRKWTREIVLYEQEFIRDPAKTITTLIDDLAARVREVITVQRFVRFDIPGPPRYRAGPPFPHRPGHPPGDPDEPQGSPVPRVDPHPRLSGRAASEPDRG